MYETVIILQYNINFNNIGEDSMVVSYLHCIQLLNFVNQYLHLQFNDYIHQSAKLLQLLNRS